MKYRVTHKLQIGPDRVQHTIPDQVECDIMEVSANGMFLFSTLETIHNIGHPHPILNGRLVAAYPFDNVVKIERMD